MRGIRHFLTNFKSTLQCIVLCGTLRVMTPENSYDSSDKSQAQLRKGILEFCILLIIDRHPHMYAPALIKKLKDIDLVVVEGTIYPLLSRLKREGLLEYKWEESKNGPPRKLYEVTKRGKTELKQHIENWESISSSISSLLQS